jgi:zinc protease
MKKYSLCIIAVFFISICTSSWAQKNPKDSFTYKPLASFSIPKVETYTLKNGMRLLLIADDKYPTIDFQAMIYTGTVFDPVGKEGLAEITSAVLRTGGSKKYPGDILDERLEKIAATIESDIDADSGTIAASALSENTDTVIEMFADIVKHPVFPEDKIVLEKTQHVSMISRRNDNPRSITGREFSKLIYGSKSPYTRQEEYSTVSSITRKDILSFYTANYVPENMIIAIWGKFNKADICQKFETSFADWKNTGRKKPVFPVLAQEKGNGVYYIEKKDMNQANILIGHIGGRYDDPDYPALAVMSRILSFERLFKRLRTDEGLAYAVGSSYGVKLSNPGIFSMSIQTKSGTAVKSIRLMLEEMNKITRQEVSDDELQRAKDQIVNGYIFDFDSKSKIAKRMLVYTYYGYPYDFSDTLVKKISTVTKQDILKAADRKLDASSLKYLILGNKKDFDAGIESFGPLKAIDITIPAQKK